MFYAFRQNNTGGSFDYDNERGITEVVIVEADSAEEANNRAEQIGIYFGGVDSGDDCPCCGDRWYGVWDKGDLEPSLYGRPIKETKRPAWIHFKDGTKVSINGTAKF